LGERRKEELTAESAEDAEKKRGEKKKKARGRGGLESFICLI
jgi:hypothetical protein